MRLTSIISVLVAVILVTAKGVVWSLSSSAALLGSWTDSALDLMASSVTLFAVKLALSPADEDHRFGHGKAEALAGLFQAGLMGASSFFLLLQSVQRYLGQAEMAREDLVVYVSFGSILLTLPLIILQIHAIRRTQSLAIQGDHLHYKGDILLNLSVVAAAMMTAKGWGWADPLAGAAIAIYIAYGSYHVARPAIDQLMDRELDLADREAICNLVLETPGVMGMHELKTRASGQAQFIQMHVVVDGQKTVHDAHLMADELEATLGEYFPRADILIHIDPPGTQDDSLTIKELGEGGVL